MKKVTGIMLVLLMVFSLTSVVAAEVDLKLAKKYPGFDDFYRVSIGALGDSDYTYDEIRAMLDKTPEEKQKAIRTLWDAKKLFQESKFSIVPYSVNESRPSYFLEGQMRWDKYKPGYHSVRTNFGLCSDVANWVNYILKDDYDEVGYMWYTTSDANGHVWNYVLDGDWYYFFDFGSPDVVYVSKTVETYVEWILENYNDKPVLLSMYTATDVMPVAYYDKRFLYIGDRNNLKFTQLYRDPNTVLDYRVVTPPKLDYDWASMDSYDFSKLMK